MSIPRASVVLVEPKTAGNVGAVARAMDNFYLDDLRLVNPCPISDEAYQRATHAYRILDDAAFFETLEDAVRGSFVVGTTGHPAGKEKSYHRLNKTPWELREGLEGNDMHVCLVFGREDVGLYNEELALCDSAVTIPTNPGNPVMNLSHSVAVLLYELYSGGKGAPFKKATTDDIKRLMEAFDGMLDAQNYPTHRREHTSIMFRRLLGRAHPTTWEYFTLMGVIKRARDLSYRAGNGKSGTSELSGGDYNQKNGRNPDGDEDEPENPR